MQKLFLRIKNQNNVSDINYDLWLWNFQLWNILYLYLIKQPYTQIVGKLSVLFWKDVEILSNFVRNKDNLSIVTFLRSWFCSTISGNYWIAIFKIIYLYLELIFQNWFQLCHENWKFSIWELSNVYLFN